MTSREQPQQSRAIEVPVVNDELALLWMVNTGCIEAHTWYSRIDKLERPDWVIFDLDPSDDVGFAETAQVALLVKQALDALGLASFPKTSGALGLHVSYQSSGGTPTTTRVAGHRNRASDRRHAHRPRDDRVVEGKATRSPDRCESNAKGKSIASVYSVRPMPGATVSTPLHWDEVDETLDPSIYTMEAVLDRLERYGDLHEGVLTTKQRLGPALRALEG